MKYFLFFIHCGIFYYKIEYGWSGPHYIVWCYSILENKYMKSAMEMLLLWVGKSQEFVILCIFDI